MRHIVQDADDYIKTRVIILKYVLTDLTRVLYNVNSGHLKNNIIFKKSEKIKFRYCNL